MGAHCVMNTRLNYNVLFTPDSEDPRSFTFTRPPLAAPAAAHDDQCRYRNHSFQDVLNEPADRNRFRRFLQGEYSSENLEFYLESERLMNTVREDSVAEEIHPTDSEGANQHFVVSAGATTGIRGYGRRRCLPRGGAQRDFIYTRTRVVPALPAQKTGGLEGCV